VIHHPGRAAIEPKDGHDRSADAADAPPRFLVDVRSATLTELAVLKSR